LTAYSINEVSEEGILSAKNVAKPFGVWSSASDPAGGAYSAPPDPLAGREGLGAPSWRTPITATTSPYAIFDLHNAELNPE